MHLLIFDKPMLDVVLTNASSCPPANSFPDNLIAPDLTCDLLLDYFSPLYRLLSVN